VIVHALFLLSELRDGRTQHQLAADLVQVEFVLVVTVDQFVTDFVVWRCSVGIGGLMSRKIGISLRDV
jgi:hypothetical protein